MKLLAVETSGFEASIALADGSNVLETQFLPTEGRRHAQILVPAIDSLLKKHGLKPAEIEVVAISQGPGSFTGLRVGIVFAKTFAWANGSRLVTVNTLHAIAQQSRSVAKTIAAVSDAQRKEVFFNHFHFEDDQPICRPQGETTIVPVADVVARCPEATLWTGPGTEKFAEAFAGCEIAAETARNPSAETVAIIGTEAATREDFADPGTLEPMYIRRSYAEEKARPAK